LAWPFPGQAGSSELARKAMAESLAAPPGEFAQCIGAPGPATGGWLSPGIFVNGCGEASLPLPLLAPPVNGYNSFIQTPVSAL
jgi:hypothetical protein